MLLRTSMTLLVAALVWFATPAVAFAHNAGHIFLPDGSCLEMASFKDGPLVGQDGTQLDLVPETPRDEYGVSFVGFWGNTPIHPGPCPAGSTAAASGMSISSMTSLAFGDTAAANVAPSAASAGSLTRSAQGSARSGKDR